MLSIVDNLSSMNKSVSILMCNPAFFDVTYEINAWMHKGDRVNKELAHKQWLDLKKLYLANGYMVTEATPAVGLPDMVFAANGALCYRDKVVLPNFKFAERRPETKEFRKWFEADEKDWLILEPDHQFEGEGDALFINGKLFGGYGFRSELSVYQQIGDFLEVEVLPLELVDERFYHLDTCLGVLDRNTVAIYANAFSSASQELIRANFDRVIDVDEDIAASFGLNLFSDENIVFVCAQALKFHEQLKELGFAVQPVDVSEFKKSGGGIKCMTLQLEQIH